MDVDAHKINGKIKRMCQEWRHETNRNTNQRENICLVSRIMFVFWFRTHVIVIYLQTWMLLMFPT
jgi:hypothetical protein